MLCFIKYIDYTKINNYFMNVSYLKRQNRVISLVETQIFPYMRFFQFCICILQRGQNGVVSVACINHGIVLVLRNITWLININDWFPGNYGEWYAFMFCLMCYVFGCFDVCGIFVVVGCGLWPFVCFFCKWYGLSEDNDVMLHLIVI